MSDKNKDVKTRQADFKARQKAAGLVRIELWIPESKKAELAAFVESLKAD